MKSITRFTIVLIFLCTATGLFAQQTEIRELESFKSLKVSQGIELVAQKGSKNTAEIEASGLDLYDVVTETRGGTLRIRIEGQHRRSNVRITLTYTEDPDEIVVNTAARVSFENEIKVERLRLSSTTSGSLKLKAFSKEADMQATTSGHIDIRGELDKVEISASTGATVDAYDTDTLEARVKANTGADIRLSAEDYLSGSASTGGSVRYKGRPKTDIRTNTGGSIRSGR